MVETRSKKRKRQRLISIASNVSSWPDLPATFESLNDDALGLILKFVGNKCYKSFGGLNYHCREIYINTEGTTKETYLYGYAPLSVIQDKIKRAIDAAGYPWDLNWELWEVFKKIGKEIVLYNRRSVIEWALQEKKKKLLHCICDGAATEERIDILDEVLNNIDDDDFKSGVFKEYHYSTIDRSAARHGKLNVLKWLVNKGLRIYCKKKCARQAVEGGQIHILEWLQEEKGLCLDEDFYYFAIRGGGHVHVLKWLREQACPWDDLVFQSAAKYVNLGTIQCLHDIGCPWPYYLRVPEHEVKPENLTWLRVNGYGNRIM